MFSKHKAPLNGVPQPHQIFIVLYSTAIRQNIILDDVFELLK